MVSQLSRLSFISCLAFALLTAPAAQTQLNLIPDTAADRNLGTQVLPVLPDVDLVRGGTRPQNGQNLFHSFQEFNIRENRGIYFENPAGVRNILTRVTGNDPSDILGTLGVLGSANLFLINPNGILFGRNASLDLGGSFYGTTASGVQFGNWGEFSAVNPQPPSNLLTINPTAFFFTTPTPKAITNQSQATQTVFGDRTFGLFVPDGQTLLLLGGNVMLDGRILAPGGRIEIAAVAGVGNVELKPDNSLSLPDSLPRADVSLSKQAFVVAATSDTGGTINITANNISILEGSELFAGILPNSGTIASQAGDVNLNATGRVQVVGQSSGITHIVSQNAIGNGGSVVITADALEIRDGAQLFVSTFGTGNAGNIVINVRDRVLVSGKSADGQDPSAIFNGVVAGAQGKGGNVSVSASTLDVLNGAIVNLSSLGTGDSGNVVINARDRIFLDNGLVTSNVAPGGQGNAGSIEIRTGALSLVNQSILNSSTFSTGNTGNLNLQVENAISLTRSYIQAFVTRGGVGSAGDIKIQASALYLLDGATIAPTLLRARPQNLPQAKGRSGNIQITTTDAVIVSGVDDRGFSSGIFSSNDLGTFGPAGNITVNTRTLKVLDGGVISATTSNADRGGDITINTHTLEALQGGQILTDSRRNGSAGSITLNASDSVVLEGQDPNFSRRVEQTSQRLQLPGETDALADVIFNVGTASGLFATTGPDSTAAGGSLTLNTPRLLIRDGAQVAVSSQGTGNAGTIHVAAHHIGLDTQGKITAETAIGQGGNIFLSVQDLLLLRRGSQISATAGTAQAGGNGGNIIISAPSGFIVGVKGENSDITANAFSGSGGKVSITAQGIFGLQFRPQLTELSDITASSTFGINGVVTLNTPNVDPSRGISSLPQNLIDTNRILANSCILRRGVTGGTFFITGTGGFPMRPGDAVLPTFATGDVRGIGAATSSERFPAEKDAAATPTPSPSTNTSIAEAQEIYTLPDGQIILSLQCRN